MSERSEADCVSNDLVERVARALVSPKADPSDWRFWTDEARAAIAVCMEEAAKVASDNAYDFAKYGHMSEHIGALAAHYAIRALVKEPQP